MMETCCTNQLTRSEYQLLTNTVMWYLRDKDMDRQMCAQPSYYVWLIYWVGRKSQVTMSSTKPDRCPYQKLLSLLWMAVCASALKQYTHTHTRACEDLNQQIMLLQLSSVIAKCAKHSFTLNFQIHNNQVTFTTLHQLWEDSLQDFRSFTLSFRSFWLKNLLWR